ncbi:MAG TPA: WD40 repeat domain-containing protein [Streptosporangiaceae bacterium]|nr:WD40 repeat domain-containing protein [Streptosporangiaceae bacterium]
MTCRFDADVLEHYVPAVLAPNGRYQRIRELVTSVGYLAAKLASVGADAVVADIQAAQRLAPTKDAARELRTLETAVAESARILRAAPGQLRGQLLSRVPRAVAPDVDALLDEAAAWRGATWLRPLGATREHGYLASFGPVQGFADALAVSDDASILLAGGQDGGLYAWDLQTMEQLWHAGNGPSVNAVTFRPDTCEALIAREDGTIVRWSVTDRRIRPFATLTAGTATSLAAWDGMLVYGCGMSVYGQPFTQATAQWQGFGHDGLVAAVAILSDGQRAVSGSYDGSIAVWCLTDGRLADRIELTSDRILCAAAVPGSSAVAVGTRDRLVVVVDLDTGRISTLRGHTGRVRSVAGLADGRVASGSDDGQVLVWDLTDGHGRRVGSHTSWCLSVAAPRGGGPVISGSNDGLVRVWDPDGAAVEALHGRGVRALTVAGGVAYAAVDRMISRFDLAAGQALPPLSGHRRPVVALAVAPGGVVSGSYDSTLRLWDTAAGTSAVLKGHTCGADAVAVTPDGTEIISAARDATWRRWDAKTGAPGPVHNGGERYSPVLALSPDGETVAIATVEHVIEIWHRRAGCRLLPPLSGHDGYVERLVITPDGRRLLSGSWDRTVRVWSLATGEPLRVLRHSGWVLDLVLTSSGHQAISACEDGSITIIDLGTLEVTATIDAHRGSVDRLALSGDDRTLFSIGSGQVRAWDTATRSLLAVFDADVPLREIAVAGPGLVVAGTATGDIIPLRLERAPTAGTG